MYDLFNPSKILPELDRILANPIQEDQEVKLKLNASKLDIIFFNQVLVLKVF